MSRTLEEYVSLPYHVRVFQDSWDDQICYMAYHHELPGCKAQGATWQEAIASLNEARRDYIAALLEDGMEIPCPQPLNAPPSAWHLVNGMETQLSSRITYRTEPARSGS